MNMNNSKKYVVAFADITPDTDNNGVLFATNNLKQALSVFSEFRRNHPSGTLIELFYYVPISNTPQKSELP